MSLMTEDEINKQVSKETGSMSSVSVGIELDREALRGLRDSVKAINKEAKEMAINFKEALGALKEMKNDYGLTQVNRSTAISPGGTGGSAPQQGAAGTQIVGGRASATQPIPPAPNAVTAALSRREVLGGGFAAGVDSAENYAGVKGKFGGGTGFTGLTQQWAGGGFTSGGNFASMAGTLAKVGIEAIDKRVEDGRAYALAADKSTLQMQQITGMSQREVMNNLRMPLTDYKLGTNGINQLMSLQARTGINASQQASSVEFMRTLSGFSMGAEGASSIIENLADPETVNKMFMMTGMSLIGPGGKQRSTQSLIQNLAKRSGLDNKKMAESAIAPGSVTRSTLSAMGVSGDLQDQVIQYAQSNVAFHEKGGKGSYDPTKEADRKKMGINDTYAMEAEETERKRGKRDEQFYRDQAGSYAKLERQTQSLTDAMGKLEHAMAPIIGARTGNRIGQKLIGGIASIAGGFAMGGPLGGALGAIGAIGSILGDPRPMDNNDDEPWGTVAPSSTIPSSTVPSTIPSTPVTTVPYTPAVPLPDGYMDMFNTLKAQLGNTVGSGKPEITIQRSGDLQASTSGLNLQFAKSIGNLITVAQQEAGITVGLTSTKRSTEDQKNLWAQRFEPIPPGYNKSYYVDSRDNQKYALVSYQGTKWKKKDGNTDPPVLPPGQSLHEIGMAADLDLSAPGAEAWVRNNLWRFNMSSGKGEPWHVQPTWAKDMKASQYLGETALSKDEVLNSNHQSRLRATLQAGSGVNLNNFYERFLKSVGTNVTLEKLQLLRTITTKEGGGAAFNPFNVVSGNNRQTPDGLERSETNYNINGDNNRFPVQNFDNIEQGLDYTKFHYMQYEKELMKVLMMPNPTMDDINAALVRGTPGVNRQQIKEFLPGVVKTYETALNSKDYLSILRGYGSTGLTKALGTTNAWLPIVGDPVDSQPLSIPSAPMLSSGSSGTGSTFHEGNTITISPVIHMNGTGGNSTVSEYDLKLMAKKIARLIEQEANINKFRSM
jgi:hypothetical protein